MKGGVRKRAPGRRGGWCPRDEGQEGGKTVLRGSRPVRSPRPGWRRPERMLRKLLAPIETPSARRLAKEYQHHPVRHLRAGNAGGHGESGMIPSFAPKTRSRM